MWRHVECTEERIGITEFGERELCGWEWQGKKVYWCNRAQEFCIVEGKSEIVLKIKQSLPYPKKKKKRGSVQNHQLIANSVGANRDMKIPRKRKGKKKKESIFVK